MSWPTVAVTLGVAVITAFVSFGGIFLQRRYEEERGRQAELREQRDTGAQIMGEVLALLDAVEPLTLGLFDPRKGAEKVTASMMDWEPLRVRLRVYAAGHPSAAIVNKAQDVSVAVGSSLNSTGWFLHDLAEKQESKMARETAEAKYAHAVELASGLLSEIRGDPPAPIPRPNV